MICDCDGHTIGVISDSLAAEFAFCEERVMVLPLVNETSFKEIQHD